MYCGYQARYTQDFISESEHCLLIREGTFNVKYLVDMQTANFIEKMSPISAWVSEIQKGRLNVYAESEPKGRKSSGGPSKEPLWLLYNCMGLGCWGHSACAQVCPVWFVNHEVSVAKCTPSTLDAHTHAKTIIYDWPEDTRTVVCLNQFKAKLVGLNRWPSVNKLVPCIFLTKVVAMCLI